MDFDPASRFVHFFHPRLRLLCGYVGAHVGWATRREQVDCPACLARLASLDAAPAVRAVPARATPLPVTPADLLTH